MPSPMQTDPRLRKCFNKITKAEKKLAQADKLIAQAKRLEAEWKVEAQRVFATLSPIEQAHVRESLSFEILVTLGLESGEVS